MKSENSRHAVFFIRGLNTYGLDHLKVGPINLWSYHRKLAQLVKHPEIEFFNVTDLKVGTVEEMSVRAAEKINEELAGEKFRSVHLLGYSLGGLIARRVAHDNNLQKKITSVTTLATPHRGAHWAVKVEKDLAPNPLITWPLKLANYDLSTRLGYIRETHPETLSEFNKNFPDLPGIRYGSVRASLPQLSRSWPINLYSPSRAKSDGLVELESQGWGDVLATLDLDHFGIIGYSIRLNPKETWATQKKFNQMRNLLLRFWGVED